MMKGRRVKITGDKRKREKRREGSTGVREWIWS